MGFRDKYIEACIKWFRKERGRRTKILSLLIGGLIFSVIFPIVIALAGSYLDDYIGAPNILISPYNMIIGILLSSLGEVLALWAVYIQFKIGRGTPVPAAPTMKLIKEGPYRYSRNPMALGTIIYYFGLSLILNSPSMIILVILFMLLLLSYIKLWEEKELEARFGDEYLEYKRTTPFLIPLLSRKRRVQHNK